MAGRTMRWTQINKHSRIEDDNSRQIPIDEAFWRAWNENPAAMRASGYFVRKTKNGWNAFIKVRTK